jgi:adenylate cyclase
VQLKLKYQIDDEEISIPLEGTEVLVGRGSDNDLVLPDYSVSRRHAALRLEGETWTVVDLRSTNGVLLNRVKVDRAQVHPGDRLKIGVFELEAAALDTGPDLVGERESVLQAESAISNATIVRSLADFNADYGLDAPPEATDLRADKRKALDEAYASHVFGHLTRLARLLITTDDIDRVLEHVMEIVFEALPVDRGFIFLRRQGDAELRCELMRVGDQTVFRPRGAVPVSKTMLEAVISERVALLTFDAQSDQRLSGTESVRIHQIRAAMCAPLWSGEEKIVGVMQVDSPHHAGSFTEQDVDLLTALANYCAVAVERLENARRAEFERQVRSRLERYHSPAVIERVLTEDAAATGEGYRYLKRAEATVLFCDLAGFTAFSEHADPEAVAELLESYFTHAVEAIFEHGGTLDKFIGDCVMAFFGAPVAQPDHARRAVEAAIAIDRSLTAWNAERTDAGQPTIGTRIAINSGPVVVGDIGSNRRVDYTVLGNTVNVAARLEQSVADPGDIVIGEETHRQLGGTIATEALGEFQLKGLSRAVAAYRVIPP